MITSINAENADQEEEMSHHMAFHSGLGMGFLLIVTLKLKKKENNVTYPLLGDLLWKKNI